MRLALATHVHAAPFRHGMDPAWQARQSLLGGAPQTLAALALAGEADAGLFPVLDLWSLQERGLFEPLADLGIAGYGPIRSVLLFGVAHPQDLDGRAVAVGAPGSTGMRLLEAWLKLHEGVGRLHWVAEGEAQPLLLTGDPALDKSLKMRAGEPRPWDLCEEWTRWTGDSFVFARWGVRRGLPQADKDALKAQLERAMDVSFSGPGLRDVAAREAARTGFPVEFVQAYLSGIRYRIGPKEERGMDRFKGMLQEL